MRQLEKKYAGACGIRLLTFNHKIQFATNPDYKEQVASVLNPIREKEFTRTILECAAIIAYKQPITRSELETVRGVNSDYAISTLISLEMIEPCGHKDAPGKPVLYQTTDNFLRRFKLKKLADLPDYDELMKKIADMNATSDDDTYLYRKDVYDPTSESAGENANSSDIGDTSETEASGEDFENDSQSQYNRSSKGDENSSSFELPDFLKDVHDGIIKIE